MKPGTLPLTVYRNVPYIEAIRFRALDFTGGTFAMQVRPIPGATGTPLISLTNATAGTQGLSVVVTEESGVDISTITVQIDEATIDAILPAASNGLRAGDDVVLYYDLLITATGITKSRWLQGTLTISEGVTI